MTHYTTLVQRCRATNSLLADEMDREFRRIERERDGEMEARVKLEFALRSKDDAMNVLMKRMSERGVPFDDLIP